MIRRISVYTLALLATLVIVSVALQAQPLPLQTRHTRDVVVSGEAVSLGRMPANQTMHIVLALGLRHQPELDNFLTELYDPSSSSYRHFLTVEEFTERFGASKEDYQAVMHFAQANGFKVTAGSRNRMIVQVTGTVGTIEKAFHVEMGVYQHPTENRTFFAPDREPSVDLPFQLWSIAGLDNYSIPKPNLTRNPNGGGKNASIGSGPGASFLGSDMRAAYYGTGSLTGAGQTLGLLEYLGTDLADLTTYYKNVNQTLTVPITLVSTDGSPTTCYAKNGCDDTEQTLDMTQACGMAPGMAGLSMYIGGTDSAILNGMATAKPLNANLSSSWYWNPADPGTDDPYFKEMGAQGQTFYDAAGDGADWQRSGSIWPADDAYVISVGGTQVFTSAAGGPWKSETTWADGGGGISPNKIPIPSWQVTTANGCSNCSKSYRNGPDVSANSYWSFYVCADQTTCTANDYGGTSFAAPMWAGYNALANQQAVANGKPLLGFIDPALYTIGLGSGYTSAFHDITTGSNGYAATTGYDLATGWGSSNYDGLIAALVGGGGGGAEISFSPASLKFGKVTVGSKSGAKKVIVSNPGTATLNITSIATTGDFALATVTKTKKVTPCVNGTALAAGASCEIKVTFDPTQTGARSGDVNFTDNAPGSPQALPLTGTGK